MPPRKPGYKRAPAKKIIRRRGPNKPAAVGDILQDLMGKSLLGKQLKQARIFENWEELVGPNWSAHGRPHSVKDRTLRIEVDSTVWMHRYAYRKIAIMRKINQMLEEEMITDIYFLLLADGESFGCPEGKG